MKEHSALLSHLKVFVLVVYCISMVVIFSMRNEREEHWSQLVISDKVSNKIQSNKFVCDANLDEELSPSGFLRLEIKGAFKDIRDHPTFSVIDKKYIEIRAFDRASNASLGSWILVSQRPIKNTTIHPAVVTLTNVFELPGVYRLDQVIFDVETNDHTANSFAFNCVQLNEAYRYSIFLSVILLVFVYTLIIFELIHRALAAGKKLLNNKIIKDCAYSYPKVFL